MTSHGPALVLSGGGARGAYQAGVLQGLADLGVLGSFPVVVGSSAGALNGVMLAAGAARPAEAVAELVAVWERMRPELVFRTDLPTLARVAWGWIRDLSFGGLLGGVSPRSLLDTRPLRELLLRIPFERIEENLAAGHLRAVAVTATDYHRSEAVLFVQGQPPTGSRQRVEACRLTVDHLLASSAIPIFFPTVEVGGRHLGDGALRNTAPLEPALRLGAERILAVGVREPRLRPAPPPGPPRVAEIVGELLDAVMLDALEAESERSGADVLWLGPSRSLAEMALHWVHRIPMAVRYLLHGLGSDRAAAELASYLLFDEGYCRDLIRLGREDTLARAEAVLRFFGRPQAARTA